MKFIEPECAEPGVLTLNFPQAKQEGTKPLQALSLQERTAKSQTESHLPETVKQVSRRPLACRLKGEESKKTNEQQNLASVMKFTSGTARSVQGYQPGNGSLGGVTHPNWQQKKVEERL